MKKNLLTIAAIFVIAITFGETAYAQFGDLINKAKDAAKKKNDKAKEQIPTGQTNGNGQSTETKDESKEDKARRIQDEQMKVEPSDVGKIYFSNKPFTTNHEGSKTTFTSGEYIYGRLELNSGTLRDTLKFSPITKDNPEHRLLYSIRLIAVNLQMTAGSWTDFSVGSANHPAIIRDSDLDKSYWNFDILPEPAKATTVVAEYGSVQFYDFLKNRAEEKTYTLAFKFEKESRDFRGVLEAESKWLRLEGRTLFEFKGSDIARIKADSEQIKAYSDRKLEQAKADRKRIAEKEDEEAAIVRIANQELPKQWTEATSPIIRGLTEPMLRTMYLSSFAAADKPHLKIIKFYAREARSSALWLIQEDEYGLLPKYRYTSQWFTVFVKNTKVNQCFFQGFGLRQQYTGGGTYGESYIDGSVVTFFNCDKLGLK